MISQLIDLLKSLGTAFLPWVIIDQWQQGVVLRFGRFNRVVGPGFHWVIPFVEHTVDQSVVTTTTALKPQSVVTKAGVVVTVEAVVRWSVSDVKTYTIDIWDGSNVIVDSAQGAIAETLRGTTIDDPVLNKSILHESRKALSRFGIRVENVTLTTLAPVKVIRLIGASQPATEPNQ
jgi:regulator of protease activity HflC (stomatin/prohibitin superfamily)